MLSESYSGGKLCYKNDLVLNRLKAHLGVFALAFQGGVISQDYTVLMPNEEQIVPHYGELVLKSIKCRGELCIRVRGVVEGFWRLYTDDFGTIVIPLPPVDIQSKIVAYISDYQKQRKCIETGFLNEIDTLHDLRTRLISDVVTGQIDVRGIEVPDFEMVEELGTDDSEPDESEAAGEADEQEE